jgi:hypothetical protein
VCERQRVKALRWAFHCDEEVAADGGSGKPWRAQMGTAERGKRSGASGGRRVEDDPAGGGAAAMAERRPGAKHCRWQASRAGPTCARKKKRGEEVRGTSLRFLESSRTSR